MPEPPKDALDAVWYAAKLDYHHGVESNPWPEGTRQHAVWALGWGG